MYNEYVNLKVSSNMSLEKEVRERNKKVDLQNLILGTVGVAGIIAVGLVAPNVLRAMKKLGLFPHERQEESILASKNRLIKKGLLEYNKRDELRITTKGKKVLAIKSFLNKKKEKKPKWDKKWRILIFDIPEGQKSDRDSLRHTLNTIGFMRLQDSVWVYPYNCEDLVTLLKMDLEIGENLLYMIVEAIENDTPIRKYFGLK